MAARTILTWPDPRLRQKSGRVEEFDESLVTLVDDLSDTLNVNMGAGLAAPQIGVPQRVVIIKCSSFGATNPNPRFDDDDLWVIVNPEWGLQGEVEKWNEACLSVPGEQALVSRSSEVTLQYQDMTGKKLFFHAMWPLAGGVQHECDHLNGRLFLSRLSGFKRQSLEKRIRRRAKRAHEVRVAMEKERRDELAAIDGRTLKPVRARDPKKKRLAKLARASRKRNRGKKK